MISIYSALQKELCLSEDDVDRIVKSAPFIIRYLEIPKSNGKFRLIKIPSKGSSLIQYWLIEKLFKHIPIDVHSAAYYTGASIIKNASLHKQSTYFLKIDLKDFFPSIKYDDLRKEIESNPCAWKSNYLIDEKSMHLLKQICFDKEQGLAMGFPASPIISNILMKSFDEKVVSLISSKYSSDRIIYTRYSDDMVFSTKSPNILRKVFVDLHLLIKTHSSPVIKLNPTKIRFQSSAKGSAIVTGLKITDQNMVTIPKRMKSEIRLMLSLYSRNTLKASDEPRLKGLINYIKDTDGLFYSNIVSKYTDSIEKLTTK